MDTHVGAHHKDTHAQVMSEDTHVSLIAHTYTVSITHTHEGCWSHIHTHTHIQTPECNNIVCVCVCVCARARWHMCSVVSDSLQPHGLQPTRLLRPCGFPGKSTGVGSVEVCVLRADWRTKST